MVLTKYDKAFIKVLNIDNDQLNEKLTFKDTPVWDSLAHMELIAAIEEAYDFMFEPEEITHFGSYENGKRILAKHGIEL